MYMYTAQCSKVSDTNIPCTSSCKASSPVFIVYFYNIFHEHGLREGLSVTVSGAKKKPLPPKHPHNVFMPLFSSICLHLSDIYIALGWGLTIPKEQV